MGRDGEEEEGEEVFESICKVELILTLRWQSSITHTRRSSVLLVVKFTFSVLNPDHLDQRTS